MSNMAYEWKTPGVFKVDAKTAGEELNRIYRERGCLEPSAVVEESRPEDAPLHACFEWDDAVAAERYRERQAGHIIRNVVVVRESEEAEPYRLYAHVESGYHPMSVVLLDSGMTESLLDAAKRELRAFKAKYAALKELAQVFEAVEALD